MLSRLTYEATNVNTNVSKYVYMQVYMWGGVFGRTYSDHDYCKSGGGIFAKLWGLGQDDRRNKRHFIVRIHVQYKIFINSAI